MEIVVLFMKYYLVNISMAYNLYCDCKTTTATLFSK